MARKSVHVIPDSNGGWNVKQGGGVRASRCCETKADAVDIGRKISKNQGSELVIHGTNGRIQRSDSHGHDPCPPKDKK